MGSLVFECEVCGYPRPYTDEMYLRPCARCNPPWPVELDLIVHRAYDKVERAQGDSRSAIEFIAFVVHRDRMVAESLGVPRDYMLLDANKN